MRRPCGLAAIVLLGPVSPTTSRPPFPAGAGSRLDARSGSRRGEATRLLAEALRADSIPPAGRAARHLAGVGWFDPATGHDASIVRSG